MRLTTTRVFAFALALGLFWGAWSMVPIAADEGGCAEGCCGVTTECGSPTSWRCCLPGSGEADCSLEPCVNYCFNKTNCNPQPE